MGGGGAQGACGRGVTQRLVDEASKEFRGFGALTRWEGRLGDRRVRCSSIVGPHHVEQDAEPEESHQQELIEKEVGDHGQSPLTQVVK